MRYGDALRSLGLSHGAQRDEVRAAFHRRAKATHPDVVPPRMRGHAEAEFKEVLEAYRLLSSRPSLYAPMTHRSSASAAAVPRGSVAHRGLVALPFLMLVLGTVSLGSSCLVFSYKKATRGSKSRNPFLP